MAFKRYNGTVEPFAKDATGTNRTVFGDTIQSDDIDDNLNTSFKLGWEIVGINDNPTKQDFNGLAYTVSNLVAYLYQQGIAEYNSSQKYMVNSIVMASDGGLYRSLTGDETAPNEGNDPITDATNWRKLERQLSVETIEDMIELDNTYITNILVTDESRGGIFYYDTERAGENDNGTVFDGWVRVYDTEHVKLEWFGDPQADSTFVFAGLTGKDVLVSEDKLITNPDYDYSNMKFITMNNSKVEGNRTLRVRNIRQPFNLLQVLPIDKTGEIAVLGDSKSHSRLHPKPWEQMWTGKLRTTIQCVFNQDDYGFESIIEYSLFHEFGDPEDSPDWELVRTGTKAPNGGELVSSTIDSVLTMSTDVKQKYFALGLTGSGTIEIAVDGVVVADNLDVSPVEYTKTAHYILDGGLPNDAPKTITVKLLSGSVGVYGVYFRNTGTQDSPMLQNYSQNGRRLIDLDVQATVGRVLSRASTLIFALGENDDHLTGANQETVLAKLDELGEIVSQYNTPTIIIDFLEGQPYSHWMKKKFRELEQNNSNIFLIDIKDFLTFTEEGKFDDATTLQSGLFHDDLTHYTLMGSSWLSNIIHSQLGLTPQQCIKWVERDTYFDVGRRNNIDIDLPDSYMYLDGYDRDYSTLNRGIDRETGLGIASEDGKYRLTATIVAGAGDDAYDLGEMGFSMFDESDNYVATYKNIQIDPRGDDKYETITLTLNTYLNEGQGFRVRIGKATGFKLLYSSFSMELIK